MNEPKILLVGDDSSTSGVTTAARALEMIRAQEKLRAPVGVPDVLRDRIEALPRRRRLMLLRGAAFRTAKEQAKAELAAAPVPSGYCCPTCHTWHPTPEARKACKEEHVRVALAAQQAQAVAKEIARELRRASRSAP